ncbi:MAG TPA: LD-carboxypeptidase [Ferruginibacter sp.]|nr:LD-carboxypeptidase [Ferruginibacter sp.]HRO17480.1 LD-carboxypeptidase [Ferruginibacter sp.]HRQ21039.1 LD-carboxypeptidase [Ferruginibacter sp.]
MIQFPPYLKKGSTIGITCPAGYMALEKVQACIHTLQSWGYHVVTGKTIGSDSSNYFSAPDEERLNELQHMLDDDSIDAILFGRGGYGTGRIIDQINFKKFRKQPKWLIGFSDITLLHQHLLSKYKIASLHAPMAAAFNNTDGVRYIEMLKETLKGKKLTVTTEPHPFNLTGKVTGILTGGNLSMLCHATGSSSEIKTRDRILFLEDVGEYIYNIDRMMYHLKRSGKLSGIKGLILGGFTDLKDTERPFGMQIDDLFHRFTQNLQIPVCFHFPVSHGTNNVPLKIGGTYQLQITTKEVTLKEK